MAAFLLESLVPLRCVRQDVSALGLGAVAFGMANPKNTPIPGTHTPPPSGEAPDAGDSASGTLPRAGRSCRLPGRRADDIASARWPYPVTVG